MTNGTGTKKSLLAVASFTAALIFFFPPAWVAALVLGVAALVEIKQSGGTLRGRGLALGGVVLSLVWSAVLGALLINAFLAAREDTADLFPPLPEESEEFPADFGEPAAEGTLATDQETPAQNTPPAKP